MKITRVILASNDNPMYYGFWNPISRIYKDNFGIKPTLIWFGDPSDIDRLNLSRQWGDIAVQAPILSEHIGWQSTWSIFWFMNLYPNDVFMTMGIDQVPLSDRLLRLAEQFDDETYLMLADDAYSPCHWSKYFGTSPTSFHVCKGSLANKVYEFESSFEKEIQKVSLSGIIPFYDHGATKWGIDESYSSHKLRQFRDSGGKVESLGMFKEICRYRIECSRVKEEPYDEKLLASGLYGDAHLCRPFSEHKDYIEKLLSIIPKI